MEKSVKQVCGALSRWRGAWQSRLCASGARQVFRVSVLAIGWSLSSASASEGLIGTLRTGHYVCEMPGDASVAPAIPLPAANFDILHGSTYATANGRGAYLLAGERMEMTNGPLSGTHFRRISQNFLRRLKPDGSDDKLRCIRQVPNNQN